MQRNLILASASPRRKDILEFLGIPFAVVHSDFPEEKVVWSDFDEAAEYVQTIAFGKGMTVAQSYPDAIILAADTSVFLDDEVFGKPKDLDDARRILQTLRGRVHEVVTGVVLMDTLTGEKDSFSVTTQVEFLPFSDQQLEDYIDTSESLGKAGAYAIQMGAKSFVRSVQGSVSNVVGLPIEEVADALERFDVPIDVNVKDIVASEFSFSNS